jgi:cell division protease FtsH
LPESWSLCSAISTSRQSTKSLNYSEFVTSVGNGDVKRVRIDGLTISGERMNGDKFETVRPSIADPDLMGKLLDKKVTVEGAAPSSRVSGCNCWSPASRWC